MTNLSNSIYLNFFYRKRQLIKIDFNEYKTIYVCYNIRSIALSQCFSYQLISLRISRNTQLSLILVLEEFICVIRELQEKITCKTRPYHHRDS